MPQDCLPRTSRRFGWKRRPFPLSWALLGVTKSVFCSEDGTIMLMYSMSGLNLHTPKMALVGGCSGFHKIITHKGEVIVWLSWFSTNRLKLFRLWGMTDSTGDCGRLVSQYVQTNAWQFCPLACTGLQPSMLIMLCWLLFGIFTSGT